MAGDVNQVSIVMRSFNEAWAIRETINMVFKQEFSGDLELIVIDSGSSDDSLQIVNSFPSVKLLEIPLGTYVPGKVLNQGASMAAYDWIVYLNADATPLNTKWLDGLLKVGSRTEKFGAAFSRQIPREDCKSVFLHDYERCFGIDRESKNWDHFFSMVSCLTHRSVLDEFSFRNDLQYAEDDEWSRCLIRAGKEVVFVDDSVVKHSHNYSFKQSYRRAFGDTKAKAEVGNSQITSLFFGLAKDVIRDTKWCIVQGKVMSLPHSCLTRLMQRLGVRNGHRAGTKNRKSER